MRLFRSFFVIFFCSSFWELFGWQKVSPKGVFWRSKWGQNPSKNVIRKNSYFLYFFDTKMHQKMFKKRSEKRTKTRRNSNHQNHKNDWKTQGKTIKIKKWQVRILLRKFKKNILFSIHFWIIFWSFFRSEIYHFFDHFWYQK